MATQETSNYILPVAVAKKLSCAYCQGYLSCGPIKMQKDKYICGRCTVNKGEEFTLQPVYEQAMSQFQFPCKFDKKGCPKQVLFNYNHNHEATCLYRTLPCPALNCLIKISASELYRHFLTCHSNCILKNNQIKFDLLRSQNRILLMYESDCVVIVKYCFSAETKLLQLSIIPVVEKSTHVEKYKLQIINGNDLDGSVNLSPKTCHINTSSILLAGEYDEYNVDNYTSILNAPSSVIIKIDLVYGDSSFNSDENRIDYKNKEIDMTNDVLEKKAEENFRENTCSKCYTSWNFCYCSRLSTFSDICCQWKGCNKIGNPNEMLKHKDQCKFKLYVCPFLDDCEEGLFKFNSLFISHLQIHAQFCPNADEVIIPLFNANIHYNNKKVYKYFTVIDNNIVRFICTVESPTAWSLVCSSPTDISVTAYFSHDHCRSVIKRINKCTRSIEYCNSDIRTPKGDCFAQFPRIKAMLKIEIASNTTALKPLDQDYSIYMDLHDIKAIL